MADTAWRCRLAELAASNVLRMIEILSRRTRLSISGKRHGLLQLSAARLAEIDAGIPPDVQRETST